MKLYLFLLFFAIWFTPNAAYYCRSKNVSEFPITEKYTGWYMLCGMSGTTKIMCKNGNQPNPNGYYEIWDYDGDDHAAHPNDNFVEKATRRSNIGDGYIKMSIDINTDQFFALEPASDLWIELYWKWTNVCEDNTVVTNPNVLLFEYTL
uniref:Uncharacterized protein n=1 Tax=Panagrolaimus sp. JU765 TaxID=591449 RepID=A0AC34QBA0_9BILA